MNDRKFFCSSDAIEVMSLRDWHSTLLSQQMRLERRQLSRAKTVESVAWAPAFRLLICRPGFNDLKAAELAGMALVAILAACVDHDSVGKRLGLSFGEQAGSSAPKVSQLRLRRLLECNDLRHRFEMLRRILTLLDNVADIQELGGFVFDWGAERRKQFAYDYYTGFAGPGNSSAEKIL